MATSRAHHRVCPPGLCTTLFVIAIVPHTAHAQSPTTVEDRVNRVVTNLQVATPFTARYRSATLAERMKHYHTPGVSIAVVDRYSVAWSRGFGVADARSGVPVTQEALFQAGSISKPIFALAVMRMAHAGKLNLDQDVNTYLTSWKVPPNDGWQPVVTLRQLLSHSAGLTVHGFPGYRRSERLPTVPQVLNGEPPANTGPVLVNVIPGTRLRYSGGGTTVAQQAVVDLFGRPFPEIMREWILGPLGMDHSTYEQPLPDALAASASTAHPWKGEALEGRWHVYPEMAAAGLWTTPTDLARAGLAVQRALKGEDDGVLSHSVINEMLTPQKTLGNQIGIGFFLEGAADSARFEHGGWDEGFVAQMTFYREGGCGAVVMVNSNEGFEILDEIMRSIALEYDWPGFIPNAAGLWRSVRPNWPSTSDTSYRKTDSHSKSLGRTARCGSGPRISHRSG